MQIGGISTERLGMKTLAAVRTHYKLVGLFLLFGVSFVWLSLLSPSDRPVLDDVNLSRAQIIVLILAVVLPYVGIWLVGLLGYIRLHDYATLIGKAEDGKTLKRMAAGILGILMSLPIMSINNSLAQVLQAHDIDGVVHIRRVGVYLVILILLWAFYTLMRSTHNMLVRAGHVYRYVPKALIVIVMLLGGLYIYFVLTNPLFENGPVQGTLPAWLAIDTIVLPRLLAWYWGIIAVWNLYQYARIVPGKIYRLAFNYLAFGVGVVTVTIILLQYLQAVSTVATLPIAIILLLIYIILVLASAGFMLVARGGKELAKIEEV
jgi:hypothetical protein